MIFNNIKDLTKENTDFRHVIYTGIHSQLVLMSLLPGEDIGEEVHETSDQILFIVDGDGKAMINGEVTTFEEHSVVYIPAGAKHNIVNTDDEEMKLYTVYSPPMHKNGTINHTKADASKEE
jgi:mannose-6-phosphate isomerase-like protein (cupin superfamily)